MILPLALIILASFNIAEKTGCCIKRNSINEFLAIKNILVSSQPSYSPNLEERCFRTLKNIQTEQLIPSSNIKFIIVGCKYDSHT